MTTAWYRGSAPAGPISAFINHAWKRRRFALSLLPRISMNWLSMVVSQKGAVVGYPLSLQEDIAAAGWGRLEGTSDDRPVETHELLSDQLLHEEARQSGADGSWLSAWSVEFVRSFHDLDNAEVPRDMLSRKHVQALV